MSLFSGAGGMDLGFARAGFNVVLANDVNADALATHTTLRSITDPQWSEAARGLASCDVVQGSITELLPNLHKHAADVVIGGPPCQGFSVAGKMDSNDPRSAHVHHFLDAVEAVAPKVFVMENVASLATVRKWSAVRESLVKRATRMGYSVSVHVLDAADYGVPQSRKRMFMVGALGGVQLDNAWSSAECQRVSVRDALGTLPRHGEPGNDGVCTAKIVPAKSPVVRASPYAGMMFNGSGRVLDLEAPSLTIPASMGGNATPIIDQLALDNPTVKPWAVEHLEALQSNDEKLLQKSLKDMGRLRRITVQEAAALQSFPRGIDWQGKRSSVLRQIGNAVPPLLGYAVGRRVFEHLLVLGS